MNLPAGSKVSLRHNVNLSQYTTMQVGGQAAHFAEPSREEDLLGILDYARHEGLPIIVMGKGSNLIFPDTGYPGLVISLLQFEKNRIEFNPNGQEVTASAGVHLYRFVLACRDRGMSGSEFLASIPGTIGGALVMNAGFSRYAGQLSEIGDITLEVAALTYEGKKVVFGKDKLEFSYRHSNLESCIVVQGKFRLWKRSPETVDAEIKTCFDFRNKKQDLKHPSSGSMFKNPPKPAPAAAMLIDRLGLKGTRVGGIMVSPRHANYFINVERGTATDVIRLIGIIQEKVYHAEKIWLEPEVRLVKIP